MTTISGDASASETSDGIKYKPLQDTQIRLLSFLPPLAGEEEIQCSLESFTLDHPPPYIALSYTWGSQKETRKILVDGQAFEATTNLEAALMHFKVEQGFHFWVDAICINQKDDDEKKHQLRQMPIIFAKARETRVWLGREADNSDRAFNVIQSMSKLHAENSGRSNSRGSSDTVSSSETPDGGDLIALQCLLVRGYWFRVWVVQEIAVSKKVTLSCGECQIPWDSMLNAAEFMISNDRLRSIETAIRKSYQHQSLEVLRYRDKQENTLLDGMQRILSIQSVRNDKIMPYDPLERPPDSLLYLLSSHRPTQATEGRDKYFALSGLCLEDESILDQTSSINSLQDIYILAAESTTKEHGHSSLDFLDFAGWPTQIMDLPSWVPDWSYTRDRAVPLLYWQLAGQKHENMVVLNAPGPFSSSSKDSFLFCKDKSLLARGFEVDRINGVGFSRWLSKKDNPNNAEIRNPDKSPQYGLQKYIIGDEDLADVIWRTSVLNITHAGVQAPEEWGHLFYERPFCRTGLNLDHDLWYEQNENFKVYGSDLKTLAQTRRHLQLESPGRQDGVIKQETMSQLLNAFDVAKTYRRLATSEKGYICLAPSTTRCGDIIAVLFDCSVPVVLREKPEHFEFIGTCYVHGIMKGEAMGGLTSRDSVEFNLG
ncbi:Heterokaryon incompatibility protein [Hyphodiscus hymeniophilus]|uniref:Heterokaryon incompatibility protein n=1 Tax=Hyphodiscus hymeniophilus TaxID=353542 RepID=A0A9P6VJ64_9HELO|nr:Heterokaryon incompatibility protein [Hyphodiscus hymeniophilus]